MSYTQQGGTLASEQISPLLNGINPYSLDTLCRLLYDNPFSINFLERVTRRVRFLGLGGKTKTFFD